MKSRRTPAHPFVVFNPIDRLDQDTKSADQASYTKTPAQASVEQGKRKPKKLGEAFRIPTRIFHKKTSRARPMRPGKSSRSKKSGGIIRGINNIFRAYLDKRRQERQHDMWKEKEKIKHDNFISKARAKSANPRAPTGPTHTPVQDQEKQKQVKDRVNRRKSGYNQKIKAHFNDYVKNKREASDFNTDKDLPSHQREKMLAGRAEYRKKAADSLRAARKLRFERDHVNIKEEQLDEFTRNGSGRFFNNILRSYLDARRDKRQHEMWKEKQEIKSMRKKVNEQQLDEVSRKLLTRYIHKANQNLDDLTDKEIEAEEDRDEPRLNKISMKISDRIHHQDRAKAKLGREPLLGDHPRITADHNKIAALVKNKLRKEEEEPNMNRKMLLEKVGPHLAALRAKRDQSVKAKEPEKKPADTSSSKGYDKDRMSSWAAKEKERKESESKKKGSEVASKMAAAGREKARHEKGEAAKKTIASGLSKAGRSAARDSVKERVKKRNETREFTKKMSSDTRRPVKHDAVARGMSSVGNKPKKKGLLSRLLRREEVEQLDEVSKKLLGRYISRAGVSARLSGDMEGTLRSEKPGNTIAGKDVYGWNRTGQKRVKGITKAAMKLTKECKEEVEQIDEVSKVGFGREKTRPIKEETKPAYIVQDRRIGHRNVQIVEKFENGSEARQKWLNDVRKGQSLTMNETLALMRKAEDSGVDYGVIKEVYKRGIQDWIDSGVEGKTPSQHAFNRINSFIAEGGAATLDADLLTEDKKKE